MINSRWTLIGQKLRNEINIFSNFKFFDLKILFRKFNIFISMTNVLIKKHKTSRINLQAVLVQDLRNVITISYNYIIVKYFLCQF